jgi:hypothetical protein
MAEIDYISAPWGGTGTTSAQFAIGNKELVGIQIPSNWVTAGLTIQASIDSGATFGTVQALNSIAAGSAAMSAYTIASITGGTQVYIAIDPNLLRGVNLIQLVATAAQTNNPTLILITRLVT